MDKIDINLLFKKYKEIALMLIITIVIIVTGVYFVYDQASKSFVSANTKKVTAIKLKTVDSQLKEIQANREKLQSKQNMLRQFFDPKNHAENSISAFGGMFEDMIGYIKKNNIMLRSVQYFINPEDDRVYQLFPANFNICKVQFVIACSYPQLLSLIKDLQTYPYFISISELKVTPYERDRKFIIAELSITLYSKKKLAKSKEIGL